MKTRIATVMVMACKVQRGLPFGQVIAATCGNDLPCALAARKCTCLFHLAVSASTQSGEFGDFNSPSTRLSYCFSPTPRPSALAQV